MTKPKWVTPERQAELVKLFSESQGFCIHVHKPCNGKWERNTTTVCQWRLPRLYICSNPVPSGEPCHFNPDEGMPRLPCHTCTFELVRWHCAYGDYTCSKPHECHFELYADWLIKEWTQLDRAIGQAEWEAEREAMHSLGERRTPVRGRFNGIGKDIFFANQPSYYVEGLGVSGTTFKPFAKVKMANSFIRLYVDLGDSLKAVSKSKRRKAIRYGKPLPSAASEKVNDICNSAVRHYLNH